MHSKTLTLVSRNCIPRLSNDSHRNAKKSSNVVIGIWTASQNGITMSKVISTCIPNIDIHCMSDTPVNTSFISSINMMKSLAGIKLLWNVLNLTKLPQDMIGKMSLYHIKINKWHPSSLYVMSNCTHLRQYSQYLICIWLPQKLIELK